MRASTDGTQCESSINSYTLKIKPTSDLEAGQVQV